MFFGIIEDEVGEWNLTVRTPPSKHKLYYIRR